MRPRQKVPDWGRVPLQRMRDLRGREPPTFGPPSGNTIGSPMAKRKKTASKSKSITVRAAAAKPIIIRQNSVPAKRSSGRRRRSGGGGMLGSAKSALMSNERLGALLGGYLLGVLDAKGTKLPTVPVLGRAGTCGVGLYYLGKHMHSPLVSHASTGFLAIAAYEMGKSGTISGDSVVGADTI